MTADEQPIPPECANRYKAIQTGFIPAPRVLFLEQLFSGPRKVKKNHQYDFDRRRQFQSAPS